MSTPSSGRPGLGCLLVSLVLLAGLGLLGLGLAALFSGPSGEASVTELVESSPAGAVGRIAVVEVSGILMDGPAELGGVEGVTRTALQMLRHAGEDPHVRGVLLFLDTPGGSVTDSDLIHAEVQRLRAQGRKVVVHMGDLCASGGYYIAVAADRIFALPTSVTGSIGVIITALNLADLLERHGIKDASITSGPNKALLSPTRPLDPAHQALLQGVVDELEERFVSLVAAGRELSLETAQGLSDGRLFTAKQAQTAGLIDAIGYRDESLAALTQLLGGGPHEVVRYLRTPSLADLFRARLADPLPQISLAARAFATPRAMYLFAPFGRIAN